MAEAGMIVSDRYPYLQVRLVIRAYQSQVWAYIETGFDGYVIIPAALAEEIGPYDYVVRWELADGSFVEAAEYLGTVEVIGVSEPLPARVTSLGREVLIGRGLVDRWRVTFDHGQRILVEA